MAGLLSLLRPVVPLFNKGEDMRDFYYDYALEHPEEMVAVVSLIQQSDAIEIARQKRIEKKLALIQKCREEIENEACDKRS